jgi:hypothetical protein
VDGWGFIAVLIIVGALIAIALLGLTVVGAARAWRNQDVGWVALIVGAWALGMGWAAALFYLVAIDAPRKAGAEPGHSPPPLR